LAALARNPGSLETLVAAILPDFREICRDFGANIAAWLQARKTADEVMNRLRGAFMAAVDQLAAAAQAAARHSGVSLPGDDLTKPFLWATLIGLANVTGGGVQGMDNFSPEALAAFAARTITVGARGGRGSGGPS
jgi:hypothetical protein